MAECEEGGGDDPQATGELTMGWEDDDDSWIGPDRLDKLEVMTRLAALRDCLDLLPNLSKGMRQELREEIEATEAELRELGVFEIE